MSEIHAWFITSEDPGIDKEGIGSVGNRTRLVSSGGACSNRYLLKDVPGPEGITHNGALVARDSRDQAHKSFWTQRKVIPSKEDRLRCAGSREARMGDASIGVLFGSALF